MKVDLRAFDLGVAYATGRGKPQDDAKALIWYSIAARSGHAEALQWVRQTADQGSAEARVNLGYMCSDGYGVPIDAVEAVRWYRLAAEQGHAEAQLILGGIYTTGKVGIFYTPGQVVARDPGEAVRWYRRAAEQGHAEAQQILGIMYAAGRGVAQDDAEALRWQLLSAEQGNAREQFLLGLMYARGRVVPKDHEQAMEWYGRAAEQGVPIHAEFRVPTDIEKVEGFRYDKSVSARQHNAKVLEKIQDLAGVDPNCPQGLLGGGGGTHARSSTSGWRTRPAVAFRRTTCKPWCGSTSWRFTGLGVSLPTGSWRSRIASCLRVR